MQNSNNIIYSPRFSQRKPGKVRYLCIVGSSGSEKSTAVTLLRSFNNPYFEFPVRYTTRPTRPDDNPLENIAVSEQEFQKLKDGNKIVISWQKELRDVGIFWYGIAKPTTPESICIISGNNAFAKQVNLPSALIVEVWADEKTRLQRINKRSKLSKRETKARLQTTDILDLSEVDIRIANNGNIDELSTTLEKIVIELARG